MGGDVLLYSAVLVYFAALIFLGYLGNRHTKDSADYLIGGGKMNSAIMALSYGATFISASAIVGFGGVAATYGMSMQWLCLLNMLVGVIIAFIFFGRRTRQMGAKLQASTFADFLGLHYKSNKVRYVVAGIIFVCMPLYAAAVMRGGVFFMQEMFGISFDAALIILTIVIAAYVIIGGMKGVMYTDAFQALIMLVCMVFLFFTVYKEIDLGFIEANEMLTKMGNPKLDLIPEKYLEQGHQGWTSMPVFWSKQWFTLVTSLILGVGVGCLAQPQLVVRFMTVGSTKELNRGVFIGCIFILLTVGIIYHVASLSNIYFFDMEDCSSAQVVLTHGGNVHEITPDEIIPHFIEMATPQWFSVIFMLCILAASMSTLSAQFHTMAASIGHDIYLAFNKNRRHKEIDEEHYKMVIRLAVILSIYITFMFCFYFKGSTSAVIAFSTSLFMGCCASSFLPSYFCALYWKKATRQGALASIWVGALVTFFSMLFLHAKEAEMLGLCQFLFDKPTLYSGTISIIDPICYALPLSVITIIVVSLCTQKKNDDVQDVQEVTHVDIEA